ncbi:MAG: hydrogenase nickel incorporation protein HypB [Planctomycetota bacterium]|nr:hydrogenase nickel incorporation protein HypB [Planctomycetota bacterium]
MTEIPLQKSVFQRNQAQADRIRRRFAQAGLAVVNLLSSPGAGKTSLLEQTAARLAGRRRIFVVEGDLETERDADRIRAAGLPARQIQTHGACHLDAESIEQALTDVDLNAYDLLLIENIGNLICPTGFDLGEDVRVVVASTTEGDDKPHKYPEAYHASDVCVLNKIDLLPYVPFRVEAFLAAARRANPGLVFFQTSCTTGEGIDAWCEYLCALHRSPA